MTAVAAEQRFTARHPCPVCGGHAGLPQGHGARCWGFLSADGGWCHCSREERAGGLQAGPDGMFSHRLAGSCDCGREHSPAPALPIRSNGTARRIVRERIYRVGTFEHVRRDYEGGEKSFFWRLLDRRLGLGGVPVARLPLYGVEVLDDAPPGSLVVVTEGEKCCDALTDRGFLAVATVTGAKGLPSEARLEALRGFDVVLWHDNDVDGRAHMERIAERLQGMGIASTTLTWSEAPEHGDAADYFEQGGTAEGLRALIDAASKMPKRAEDDHPQNDGHLRGSWSSSAVIPSLITLTDVAPERVSWLWPGRVPLGKVTILDGDPGLGKSTLCLDLAARVSTGAAMPDGVSGDPGGPAAVVILSAEDGLADTIRPRLEAAGADLSCIVALVGVHDTDGERLPTLGDLGAIEQALLLAQARLLIVDPLMAFLPDEVRVYSDHHVRRALAPLAALAERTGVAVIVIRHLNKSGGANPVYRGGGSIGIVGAARSAFLVAADPDDPEGRRRILAPVKTNLAATPPALAYHLEPVDEVVRVAWEGVATATAASLLASQTAEDGERGALEDAKSFLTEALVSGPLRADQVKGEARSAGVAERTLWRAKQALRVEAHKDGFSGPWVWSLPEPPRAKAAMESPRPPTQNNGSLGADLAAFDSIAPEEMEEAL